MQNKFYVFRLLYEDQKTKDLYGCEDLEGDEGQHREASFHQQLS